MDLLCEEHIHEGSPYRISYQYFLSLASNDEFCMTGVMRECKLQTFSERFWHIIGSKCERVPSVRLGFFAKCSPGLS